MEPPIEPNQSEASERLKLGWPSKRVFSVQGDEPGFETRSSTSAEIVGVSTTTLRLLPPPLAVFYLV